MDKVTETWRERLEHAVMRPLVKTGRGYYLLVGVLLLVVLWGLYAYNTQARNGLIMTGMRDRISWGFYIILFVFFIGISHAGTLISAILRVVKAQWRTPVTRMAEFITVVALSVGGLLPLIDLGRPDRMQNLLLFGRWQSPIVWDLLSITTYLTGSIIYLYLPLIPDFAICRDRLGKEIPAWKRTFYRVASLGWRGTAKQRKYLNIAIGTMMVLIIPVAVSVHTVVSWIFAMTLRESWNSTTFGPFFVAGAIFSGIAALIIIMAVLRKIFKLEEYITEKHFVNLGYMLGGFTLIMAYFNIQEYIVPGYKMAGQSSFHFLQLFAREYAPFFWLYTIGGIVIPGLIILFPRTRNLPGILIASGFVLVGMWTERFLIVIAGLRVPLMPYDPSWYVPTWVEWSIMAALFAMFGLVIATFVKLFPVVSLWEVSEQHEEGAAKEISPEPKPTPAKGSWRIEGAADAVPDSSHMTGGRP